MRRSMLGIGLTWALLWVTFWAIVLGVVSGIDPDSVDPGEGLMALVVFGPMGLISGIAFAWLLSREDRGTALVDVSLVRVTGLGFLASAIGQAPFLGHGDQGLMANLLMALLFSILGGVVTMGWLFLARRWTPSRASRPAV